jgi:hypothetical protein
VFDTARQLHFTRSLEQFSAKLGELLERARLHQPQMSPGLLDEIALTTGELMIVLTNHSSEDSSLKEVLTHAKSLRERLRTGWPQSNQVTNDCDRFNQEIAQLLIDSKKAA